MKLKLEQETLHALANDTRIQVLQSLEDRRKTLTELADELELANSTVSEHLDTLTEAELVEKQDEGRKWKYYELTEKGRRIITPTPKKAVFLFAAAIVAAGTTLFAAFTAFTSQTTSYAAQSLETARQTGETTATTATQSIPYLELGAALIAVFIAGVALGYTAWRQGWFR